MNSERPTLWNVAPDKYLVRAHRNEVGMMEKSAIDAERGLRRAETPSADVAWLAVAYTSLLAVVLLGQGTV